MFYNHKDTVLYRTYAYYAHVNVFTHWADAAHLDCVIAATVALFDGLFFVFV